MRYAIISDNHANLEATITVLEYIDKIGVDQIVHLGDVVGYNANPNECCDLIRERTSAGMQAAKRRGRRIGRPKVVLSRPEVAALREQGLSNAEIARRFNVSRPTLIRELRAMGL